MRHIHVVLCTLFLLLTTTFCQASQTNDKITLNIPESALAGALAEALPLEYTTTSKKLQGKLTLISIRDLKITDQHLACQIQLAGDQLTIATEVAGHNITLNLGSIEMDFKAKAKLRFDREKQTLFITPVIDQVNGGKESGKGDIGDILMQLVDGREFPVSMKDIDPIVARTGAKTLTIVTRIADIRAEEKQLQLLLEPHISTHLQ